MINRGSIVLVEFPYSDLSSSKIRPAVVISNAVSTHGELTVIFITSVLTSEANLTDVLIDPKSPVYADSGLRKPSLVRCSKIATIHRSLVEGILGQIPKEGMKSIESGLRHAFGL